MSDLFIDPVFYFAPQVWESRSDILERHLGLISILNCGKSSDSRFLISLGCLTEVYQNGLHGQSGSLRQVCNDKGIDLDPEDILSMLERIWGCGDYFEEVFPNCYPQADTRIIPNILARIPQILRPPLIQNFESFLGRDRLSEIEIRFASLKLIETELQIIGDQICDSMKVWIPVEENSTWEQIVDGWKEFDTCVNSACELISRQDGGCQGGIKDFSFSSKFIDSIERTGISQDRKLLETLIYRCSLFLLGLKTFEAHKLKVRNRADSAEKWHFYLTEGHGGWRVKYWLTSGAKIEFDKIGHHDDI